MSHNTSIFLISSVDRNVLYNPTPYKFSINLPYSLSGVNSISVISLKCGVKIQNVETIINTDNYLSFTIDSLVNNIRSDNPCLQKSFGLIENNGTGVFSSIVPNKLSIKGHENINTISISIKKFRENEHLCGNVDMAVYFKERKSEYEDKNISSETLFYFICLKIYSHIWNDEDAKNRLTNYLLDNDTIPIKDYLNEKKSGKSIIEKMFSNCNFLSFLESKYCEDVMWVFAYGNYQKEIYMAKIEKQNKTLVEQRKGSDVTLIEPDFGIIDSFFKYSNIKSGYLVKHMQETKNILGENTQPDFSLKSQVECILELSHD